MTQNKYINNKDLLAEIHVSKLTYCSYLSSDYTSFDMILFNMNGLNSEAVAKARARKAAALSKLQKSQITPEDIPVTSLVFRVMTSDHIPKDAEPDRKRRRKGDDIEKQKTNFPPFKHYVLTEDGTPKEVLRSHWIGDFETGHFSVNGGHITNRLANMFKLLVDQYARRGNWRNYTWVDEMKGMALFQLSQVGLKFCESIAEKTGKPANPFAFYTQIIRNCFRRVILFERKHLTIRDDLLIIQGAMPSFRRQVENELEYRAAENEAAYRSEEAKKLKLSKDLDEDMDL